MISLVSDSALATHQIGYRLGKLLRKGDIVCLQGGLGTGKTAFAGGIAEALGVKGYITSPTFTIVNEYEAEIPLYHFDVYRIESPDEMYEIGFNEYIAGDGIVIIEWADIVRDLLPRDYIWVDIKKDLERGLDVRMIDISFNGERYRGFDELLLLGGEGTI